MERNLPLVWMPSLCFWLVNDHNIVFIFTCIHIFGLLVHMIGHIIAFDDNSFHQITLINCQLLGYEKGYKGEDKTDQFKIVSLIEEFGWFLVF